MATAHGIVILEGRPEKFSITARVVPDGQGHLYLKGKVSDAFPQTFGMVISAIRHIADHMDLDIDAADIMLRLNTPHDYPLAGGSYALPAAISILAAADGKVIPNSYCYTGCLDSIGNCSQVTDIGLKRRGAASFGFDRLFLPRSQIDMFSTYIAQCPVKNLGEAYGITFWGNK